MQSLNGLLIPQRQGQNESNLKRMYDIKSKESWRTSLQRKEKEATNMTNNIIGNSNITENSRLDEMLSDLSIEKESEGRRHKSSKQ